MILRRADENAHAREGVSYPVRSTKKSNQKNVQGNHTVCGWQRWVISDRQIRRYRGNHFIQKDDRYYRISNRSCVKIPGRNLGIIKVLVFMNHCHILATGRCIHPMTRGHLALLRTSFCLVKKRNTFHMATTMMNTHHETGAGKQHQEGEGQG